MTDEPTPTRGASALEVDRIPPDPAALIPALAAALAAVHLSEGVERAAEADRCSAVRRTFDHASAARSVAARIVAGWNPPEGSPYQRAGADALGAAVASLAVEVARRAGGDVLTTTIGDATFANLVSPMPLAEGELATAVNLTFRRSPMHPTEPPRFASWADAARSDTYRDLSVAMADVVTTFGPGAVLGFIEAYVTANPGVEPVDPIRLDWWSMVTAVLGAAPSSSAGSASSDRR